MTAAERPEDRPDPPERESGEDDAGRREEQEGREGGAGPAEDLQEDPAYNPQGPVRKYKGG